MEKLKNWGNVIVLIVNISILLGLLVQCGRLQSGLDDLRHIRENVESLRQDTTLIKAKINNEIIPRLNHEKGVKPLAGVPIQKEITVGEAKYRWAVPYKAIGGESVGAILTAAEVPWEQAKINEVVTVNPNSLVRSKYVAGTPDFVAVRGAEVLIPVSDSYVKKYLGETVEFREKLLIHKEPASPKEQESRD